MNKAVHIVWWILIGVAGLAAQFYIAKLATETEKDPDLAETAQFTPEMYPEIAAGITREALEGHIEALSGIPSRLTGTAGADEAADYILAQFRELGVGEPVVREFPVTVPVHDRAEIQTAGRVYPMHPLYPNGVCPPASPEEGLETRLVYAGFGRLSDIKGKDIAGSTVVVETGGREQWLYLIDLGAEAIIFVEHERPARSAYEFTQTGSHQSVPRFWMTKSEGAPLLERVKRADVPATLHCDARWEQRVGKNIWVEIPGVSDAPHNVDEFVVLESYYDSASFAPDLAPGAEQTCGIAALLELAKVVRDHPFEKRVRILATAGHFQALGGIRRYVWEEVGRHDSPMRDVSPQSHAALLSLDLSSSSERVGLFYGGMFFQQLANNLKPRLADLGRRATHYVAGSAKDGITGIASVLEWVPEVVFVDTINPVAGKDWPNYMPTPMALDHEAALLAGVPALSFVTTNDTRMYSGTPEDREVRVENLVAQTRLLACLLPNAFNVEGRYLKRSLPRSICHIRGRVVSFDPRAGYLPDKPVPGAVVTTRSQWMPLDFFTGVSVNPVTMTDEDGRFELVGLGTSAEVPAHVCTLAFESYMVERGRITWAPDFGGMGKESYKTTIRPVQKEMELMCVAFECKSLELYNLIDPRNQNFLVSLQVLEAASNSVPPVYGSTFVEPTWGSYFAPTATIFAPQGTRLKVTAGAGALNKRKLLLNVPEEVPEGKRFNTGEGFNVDDTPALYLTDLQGAEDMWRLNDSRIAFFGRHGIENARVNELHAEAGNALERARECLEEKDYKEFATEARKALSLESRAYPDVLGMANSTVRGLVFYLALLLPFAFAMERLLLAGRRIETRILGIVVFFLGMFLLLRFTHPGFLIVLSPMVVLLGFLVAVLSTVVISIVMGKLETLVSRQKVEQQGEHESGVQAISGITLALELGIANMRRRRARTILTSVTLILLTFSVLSFVSVTERVRMQRYGYDEGATPYPGVLLRTKSWDPFPFETYASLRNELAGKALAAPRRWYSGHLTLSQSSIDIQQDDTIRSLRALIGLTAQEEDLFDVQSALLAESRWLAPEVVGTAPPEEVLLPLNLGTVFAHRGMTPEERTELVNALLGERVKVLGRRLTVAGVFDSHTAGQKAKGLADKVLLFNGAAEEEKPLRTVAQPFEEIVVVSRVSMPDFVSGRGEMALERGDSSLPLAAILGMTEAEGTFVTDCFLGDSRWPAAGEVLVPLEAAVTLVLGRDELVNRVLGTKVKLLGRDFTVTGVFDWARMNEMVDIDGESLTPVDPVQMERKNQEEGVPDPDAIQRYIHHSFKDVAILHERVLGDLGGDVRSLAIRPNDPEELEALVEGLVKRMDYILFANLDGEPTLLSSRNAKSISEFWNPIVLGLIAALIVFNTMLGSVYERTKEIGTYTALGIAPSHIGRLFLVEAGVFSIIGVMAGYVLGQGVSRVVHVLDVPVLSALDINYSSFWGVGACVIVMLMVLVSTMYPARKASEIGVPDIDRRWKLPRTKEARITLELPFTVSPIEAQGLVAFLKEYLDSHVDVSVGRFYVENICAGREVGGEEEIGVTGQFWLTPFDLGVSQYTTFVLRHLEGMDACGIRVAIERLSGDAGSWRRANGRFMTNMRAQFLMWRNLSPESRAEYIERGAEYALPQVAEIA